MLSKHPNQAIVEAGGVGYEVNISIPTFSGLPALGSEVSLAIYTHVREDALALYGFLRTEDKQLFEKLISVSGIGPRLAITILSGMPADAMVGAIKGNNIAVLVRIPGVGRKTAERMVLELRDKLDLFGAEPALAPISPVEEDVLSALVNLGYNRGLVEKTLGQLAKGPEESFDNLFRRSMAALAK